MSNITSERLNDARQIVDAWCERWSNGMPPVTARDKLATDILGLSSRERPDQAEAWQPIETAPKDGTVVDLWVVWPEYEGADERQERRADCFFKAGDWHTKNMAFRLGMYAAKPYATHWQPLPAPPTPSDTVGPEGDWIDWNADVPKDGRWLELDTPLQKVVAHWAQSSLSEDSDNEGWVDVAGMWVLEEGEEPSRYRLVSTPPASGKTT